MIEIIDSICFNLAFLLFGALFLFCFWKNMYSTVPGINWLWHWSQINTISFRYTDCNFYTVASLNLFIHFN